MGMVVATIRFRDDHELQLGVEGLARISLAQMQRNPGAIPPLYGGRIRYVTEPRREWWQSALDTAAIGTGDCEDLVAYRLAELWRDKIPARAHIKVVNPQLRHVMIRLPNGTLEDPSARLGMPVPDAGKRLFDRKR